MRDAELERAIVFAERAGIHVDTTEAAYFLLAKRVLSDPSSDEYDRQLAQRVTENFAEWMKTGKQPESFAGLILSGRHWQVFEELTA